MHTRLADLRNQHNLGQKQVADIIGVARNTYGNYETGERQMPYESLIMLADHYRVSIDYLLNRTDTPFMAERYTDEELEVMQEFLNLYKFIKNRY